MIAKKNTVNVVLENLKLNEVKSIKISHSESVFKRNGKYYKRNKFYNITKEIPESEYNKYVKDYGDSGVNKKRNDTQDSINKDFKDAVKNKDNIKGVVSNLYPEEKEKFYTVLDYYVKYGDEIDKSEVKNMRKFVDIINGEQGSNIDDINKIYSDIQKTYRH